MKFECQDLNEFVLVKIGNKAQVLFPFAYTRYDSVRLDAYYLASQSCYEFTRDLVEKLRLQGYSASLKIEGYLRELAIKSGLAAIGYNQLVYHKSYGSSFVVGSFMLEGDFEQKNAVSAAHMPCKDCGACIKACPTNALEGGVFHMERCIRAHMSKGEVKDNKIAAAFGSRILGCDICQRACPLNSARTTQFPPQLDIYLDEILIKNTAAPLKPIIGSNMARLNKLKNLAIIAAGNDRRIDLLPYIEQAEQNPIFKVNAQRAIKLILDL